MRSNARADSSIAPCVSAACTAKPSTFDRSNPGTSTSETNVLGEYPAERRAERHLLPPEGLELQMLLKARGRLVAGDDVEELSLTGILQHL